MKVIATILISLIILASCKKKETPPVQNNTIEEKEPARDFMFIPMKDARWKTRYSGSYRSDGTYDTEPKFLITIEAMGKDTVINNMKYYMFMEESNGIYNGKGVFYLREDTLGKKVYYATIKSKSIGYPPIYEYELNEDLFLNYNLKVGDKIGAHTIDVIDSFLFNDLYLLRWRTSISNFLQSYCIGGRFGLYSGYNPGHGAGHSGTTFFYKGDSIKIY